MNTSQSIDSTIEELLEAAGFDFAAVVGCPHPQCDVCSDAGLAAAA